MSRIAVTGGSGKLGRAVIDELLEHGYEVTQPRPGAAPRAAVPLHHGRLTDYGQTYEALTHIDSRHDRIDALVHLAAIPGPGLAGNAATFTTNITSSFHVFAAARAAGITNVVWASIETLLGLPFDTRRPTYRWTRSTRPARKPPTRSASTSMSRWRTSFCRWNPR